MLYCYYYYYDFKATLLFFPFWLADVVIHRFQFYFLKLKEKGGLSFLWMGMNAWMAIRSSGSACVLSISLRYLGCFFFWFGRVSLPAQCLHKRTTASQTGLSLFCDSSRASLSFSFSLNTAQLLFFLFSRPTATTTTARRTVPVECVPLLFIYLTQYLIYNM